MRISRVVLITLLMAGTASTVWADPLDEDVEGYLAEVDTATLRRAPMRLLAVDPATDKPAERWHGLIEIRVWAPLFATGSAYLRGAASVTSSSQAVLAQSGVGGSELVDVDEVSGLLVPLQSRWWRGRWGILFDVTYADLNPEGTLLGPLGVPFDLDLQFGFVDLAASWAPLSPEVDSQRWLIHFFLGARFVAVEQRFTAGSLPTVKASDSYWEPLLGAGFGYEFSERWSLYVRQDVSGFGVSDVSEFTFNLHVGVNWRFGSNKHGVLSFGWRLLNIDLRSESGPVSLGFNLTLHGPFLGIGYNF